MNKKRIIIGVIVLVAVATVIYLRNKTTTTQPTYQTGIATQDTLVTTVTASGNTPIRRIFDHLGDPCLPPLRHKLYVLNRFQCVTAQTFLLHADKPLWRCTENDRRTMAPTMRITVLYFILR